MGYLWSDLDTQGRSWLGAEMGVVCQYMPQLMDHIQHVLGSLSTRLFSSRVMLPLSCCFAVCSLEKILRRMRLHSSFGKGDASPRLSLHHLLLDSHARHCGFIRGTPITHSWPFFLIPLPRRLRARAAAHALLVAAPHLEPLLRAEGEIAI